MKEKNTHRPIYTNVRCAVPRQGLAAQSATLSVK